VKIDLCYYGCGQKAMYELKNGRGCCSSSQNSCPEIKRKNKGNRESKKGNKNPMFRKKHTTSSLQEMSKSHKGKKKPWVTERNKKLINNKNPMFGKKRLDVIERNKKSIGDKSYNWHGGSSFEPYSPEFNNKLKEQIRNKFDHTCVLCGEYAKVPHHIDYNKKNNREDNFVLLCKSDNSKVNKNRVQWEIYFRLFLMMWGK
jgi:hypothetical protein